MLECDLEVVVTVTTSCASLCMCGLQMGYATSGQTAAGIHTRLYSRAFIIDDGKQRVVFVTVDVGMISQRLRLEVHTHTHITHTHVHVQFTRP